jgi:oligopeptide/dipeptide ABC transporter ATP-binding protein
MTAPGPASNVLLEVRDLRTHFHTDAGVARAVDGISFDIGKGECVTLVGESGCGKSVTSLTIMRLLAMPPARIAGGTILFKGRNLLELTDAAMCAVRGREIAMIFQEPQTALNPVFQVSDQISEVLGIHKNFGKRAGKQRAVELLKMVGIPDAERRAEAYPHELSGGMAQRVMIAMALACVPELLIADEPTTALDVTIQAQILDLMRDLRAKMGTSVILITHDLGVVAEMAERVAVMYAGEIVEQAEVNLLFDRPMHPYTQGLIGSIPVLGQIKERLDVIPGSVPNLVNLPPGCRFAPRCAAREKYGLKICTDVKPDLKDVSQGHLVRCWLYQDARDHQAPLKAD